MFVATNHVWNGFTLKFVAYGIWSGLQKENYCHRNIAVWLSFENEKAMICYPRIRNSRRRSALKPTESCVEANCVCGINVAEVCILAGVNHMTTIYHKLPSNPSINHRNRFHIHTHSFNGPNFEFFNNYGKLTLNYSL